MRNHRSQIIMAENNQRTVTGTQLKFIHHKVEAEIWNAHTEISSKTNNNNNNNTNTEVKREAVLI